MKGKAWPATVARPPGQDAYGDEGSSVPWTRQRQPAGRRAMACQPPAPGRGHPTPNTPTPFGDPHPLGPTTTPTPPAPPHTSSPATPLHPTVPPHPTPAPDRQHPGPVPTCPACDNPYLDPRGCTASPYPHAHRWGDESQFTSGGLTPVRRCIDCATPIGRRHHARCLQAQCRRCGDQAACCACGDDETTDDTTAHPALTLVDDAAPTSGQPATADDTDDHHHPPDDHKGWATPPVPPSRKSTFGIAIPVLRAHPAGVPEAGDDRQEAR